MLETVRDSPRIDERAPDGAGVRKLLATPAASLAV
jgi:hypothetical protein